LVPVHQALWPAGIFTLAAMLGAKGAPPRMRNIHDAALARASLELVEKATDDMDVDTGMGAGASNKPVTPS
jgi:hypothetical protein